MVLQFLRDNQAAAPSLRLHKRVLQHCLGSLFSLPPCIEEPAIPLAKFDWPKFSTQYDIGVTLGQGGFSIVKEAIKKSSGEKFAVKVVSKQGWTNDQNDLLIKEISILRQMNHVNIASLIEFYDEDDALYLVMELMAGGDLLDRILSKSQYNINEAQNVARQLLHAIQHFHALNIIHRDLKPENIFLPSQDNDESIKVGDFGLATTTSDTNSLTQYCGTMDYMAPEVQSLRHTTASYTKSVDIWSAGIIVYAVLTGSRPILDEDSSWSHDPVWYTLSADTKDFVMQMLTVDPPNGV